MGSATIFYDDTYQVFGINVSDAKKLVEEVIDVPKFLELTISNESGATTIRIRSVQLHAFNRIKKQILEHFKAYEIFGPNQSIADLLVEALINRRLKISCAESMTGGLISAMITAVPNSSKIFKESYIVYSDESKQKILGVDGKLIQEFGVASKEVALSMVENLARMTLCDICVSVTGFAGPSTDDKQTPVGTVCIGLKIKENIDVLSCFFEGSRQSIRLQSAMTAIATILSRLTN